ncbi:hypothetical protein [Streptomyces sp. BR123]|uniref:hypothetical protein n=1 Tax=Streptomyces sp. BR123 TaxID=2749828 RepID=UPI00211AD63B|nr:hypothetical protein [Streptomyces sp. BR123]
MRLMPYGVGAALLSLLALPAPSSSAAAADPAPAHARYRHTAADISRFLTTFYGNHGPSDQDRSLRVSQHLKDRQALSRSLDILLCAPKEPRGIAVGPVTVAQSANVGWATVTTHWDDGTTDTFTAYVRLDSQPITLDDVICAG